MSHKIAHLPLDFAGKTSVCGARSKRDSPHTEPISRRRISPRQRRSASAGLRR
jgi:hypothetical protein